MAVISAGSLDSGLTTLRGAAVSPSGRLAVTYGVDVLVFTVTIWDVATRQHIRQIENRRAPMTVSFTPDEAAIVGAFVAQEDGSAEVIRWPVTETAGPGEVLHTETGVAGVAMSRDTRIVIFRSATGSVTVLDTGTGFTQPVGPSAQAEQVAVSPRGTLAALASGTDILTARISRGRAGEVVTQHRRASGRVQAMDCTAEAVLVAEGNTVSAALSASQDVIFAGSDPVREMAVSTAGDVLAVAQGNRVDLLSLLTTAVVDQVFASSPVVRLTFSLDDKLLVTAHDDNIARLWDLAGSVQEQPTSLASAVLEVSPNDRPLPDPVFPSGLLGRMDSASASALNFAEGVRQLQGQTEVLLGYLIVGLSLEHDGPARRLLDRAGIGPAELLSAISEADSPFRPFIVPFSSLASMPNLAEYAKAAVDQAAGLADASSRPVITSMDLLRGALSVGSSEAVQALARLGVDLAALDALASPLPPAPPGRAPLLAGAAADTVPEPGDGRVRQADRLGIAAEVEMLVSILMASDTPLPLAVGLFGDWGSGKSFFMALMQERIDELALLSSKGRPEAAPFCSQVRQVRFNAWHYVDTNLWASLAATLFDELASPKGHGGDQAEADQAKLAQLDDARHQVEAAQRQRRKLEREVSKLAAVVDRPSAAVKSTVSVAIRAVRGRKIRQDLAGLTVTPGGKEQGEPDPDTDRLISVLGEVDGVAANARVGWRLFQEELLDRQRRKPTLITLAVLLALAAAAAVALNSSAAIKAWTFAGAVLVGLSPALSGAVRVLYLVREARDARELPLVRKREELDKALAKERDAEQQVALRELELAQLRDKGLQLQEFIRERAASSDYRGRLGVISQVRRDFEHLVALVPGHRATAAEQAGAEQVAEAAAVVAKVTDVERIVLYVDDLDRCPSEKVVEVLQAVHLLLAFKLFVVVVGVDSRWLERSLTAHYEDLLEEPGNYLEKIFQIPFILQRMTPSRFQELIEGLTPRAAAPSGPGGGPPPGAIGDIFPDTHAGPVTLAGSTASGPATSGTAPSAELAPPGGLAPPGDAAAGAAPAGSSARGMAAQGTASPEVPPVTASAAPVTEELPPALPRPETLVISDAERALLGRLGSIVPTPRAAKRLVNIYRMLRVSVPEDELGAFGPDSEGDGEYQAVILLLALLVGRPAEAVDIFAALRAAGDGEDVWQVLDSYAADRRQKEERSAGSDGSPGDLAGPSVRAGDVAAALRTLREHVTVPSAGPYRRWAPRVARFSFRLGTVPPGDEW